MQIYPSILETNTKDFEKTLVKLTPVFDYFQIDIADGILVPNKTIQIEDISSVIYNLQSTIYKSTFEFHLMVADYPKLGKQLNELKDILSIQSALIHLKVLNPDLPNYPNLPYGLVLNPENEVTKNYEIISKFPIVQIMTVNPGKQGSPFLPDQLEKINELRAAGFSGKIILDGGINDQTLPIILKNKHLPDAICPGSYFTKAQNPQLQLDILESILGSKKPLDKLK